MTFAQPAVSNIYPSRVSFSACFGPQTRRPARGCYGRPGGVGVPGRSRRRSACSGSSPGILRARLTFGMFLELLRVAALAYRVSPQPPPKKVTSCFLQHLQMGEVSEQRGRRNHMTTARLPGAKPSVSLRLLTLAASASFRGLINVRFSRSSALVYILEFSSLAAGSSGQTVPFLLDLAAD